MALVVASTLFLLSGALGLGYQLVWIRKAALLVGGSQIALATVLTSFFLGLACGSLVVGRHLRSTRWSPLFVYGLFEAAIGAFALAFPFLFEGVGTLYQLLYPLFQGAPAALFGLRFALLFALFLVPTFFMGGTLPLLLDGLVARNRSIGSLTSFLYGLNIVGAVLGVLFTAYFAIPQLGMNGTSIAAGVGNLSIAVVATAAFGRARPLHPPEAGRSPSPVPVFFAALAFLSGLAAIGYQVFWARYFQIFTTNSVYLVAVLLAVFLAALATGSMLLAPLLARRNEPLRILAVVQPLVPVCAVASLELWRFAGLGFTVRGDYEVQPSWSFVSETADAIFFAPVFQVALVIFVPVVLLGTGLPSLIAAATRRSEELRAHAGSLVFWNTLGSSAGGFVAGYLLIPGLGLTGTLLVLAAASIGFGLAAAWRASGSRRPLRSGALLGLGSALLTLWLLPGDVTKHVLESYGWGSVHPGSRLVELVEGPLTTAFVYDSPQNLAIGSGNVCHAEAPHHALASHAIQGHIPALFYPRRGAPQQVLGIALGSGQSFGALLRHPIGHMDVVDISSEMMDLSLAHFAAYNNDLGNDPRVSLHLDDGRHFVDRAAPDSYDVVTLEPPPIASDGVYSLYSLEFYQGVERILREGGLLVQWMPLYFVTPMDLQAMLKTQSRVFPNTFVLKAGPQDLVALSFPGPSPPVFHTAWIAERARIFREEPFARGMRWEEGCRYEVASLPGILSLLLTGPEDIARIEVEHLHRDDDQRISYSSGDRQLFRRYRGKGLALLSFAALPLTPFAELARYFAEPIPAAELDEERARSLVDYGVPSPARLASARERFERAPSPTERSAIAFEIAELHDRRRDVDAALDWVGRALAAHPTESRPEALEVAARIVRRHAALRGRDLRGWLDARPPEQRGSLVIREMTRALEAFEARAASRRAAYLWPPDPD